MRYHTKLLFFNNYLLSKGAKQRLFIVLLVISATHFSNAQTRSEAQAIMDDIETEEEIAYAIQYLPEWTIRTEKLTQIDEGWARHKSHTTPGSQYPLVEGDETYLYKLISMDSTTQHRVSYIFLDGRKYKYRKIDGIRNKILKRYSQGETFASLASKYSMDVSGPERGGDLGWFNEKTMIPEFEKSISKQSKGDIFTVDSVLRRWYFVVLKTHDDRKVVQKILAKIKIN